MSTTQIIIKKYDNTLIKVSLPDIEAEAFIKQLTDKQDELAAHEYHRRVLNSESNRNQPK